MMRIGLALLFVLVTACAPPLTRPRCTPPEYDVVAFGAVANDAGDDRAPIQAAIECARAHGFGSVHFPPGRYVLHRAIEADVDDLTLSGTGGAILVVDPDAKSVDTLPEAILVNRPVKRVTIRDLVFDVRNGSDGSVSYGVVQLNACQSCVVENVHLFWGGGPQKPRNVDGIVFSQGTSGRISGAIVDGIPKAGIYLAQGAHDVVVSDCEVMNTDGPMGRVGVDVRGATSITISACRSHHNADAGMQIATNDRIQGADPVPSRDISVIGGDYSANAVDGIRLASTFRDFLPGVVQLSGISAHHNALGAGIAITGATDVAISAPILHDNGIQGVLAERSTRILITDAFLFDNGRSGTLTGPIGAIHINSATDVTIDGGRSYRTSDAARQQFAIQLTGSGNDAIRILDLDGAIRGDGAPGSLVAPEGAQYIDWPSGTLYRREGGRWVTP